jgi:hypothetical protein
MLICSDVAAAVSVGLTVDNCTRQPADTTGRRPVHCSPKKARSLLYFRLSHSEIFHHFFHFSVHTKHEICQMQQAQAFISAIIAKLNA